MHIFVHIPDKYQPSPPLDPWGLTINWPDIPFDINVLLRESPNLHCVTLLDLT